MLSRSTITRWSGPLSIIGSMLLLVCGLLQVPGGKSVQAHIELYVTPKAPLSVIFSLLFAVALMLLAIGLMGLYERLTRPGTWAKVGLILAHLLVILAIIYVVINVVATLKIEAFVGSSWLALVLAVFSLGLGLVSLGIATVREENQRWRNLPLVVGVSGFAILLGSEDLDLVLLVLYCMGWVLLGYTLWTDRRNPSTFHG